MFLFEKDTKELVTGATIGAYLSVKIELASIKISGSAKFDSVNNETEKDNTLKVKFHGDYLIGKLRSLNPRRACVHKRRLFAPQSSQIKSHVFGRAQRVFSPCYVSRLDGWLVP